MYDVARADVHVMDLLAAGLFRDLWRAPRSEKENAGTQEQVGSDARAPACSAVQALKA